MFSYNLEAQNVFLVRTDNLLCQRRSWMKNVDKGDKSDKCMCLCIYV